MNNNKSLLVLIFSICLILALACGGGGGSGGPGGGAGGSGDAGGPGGGGTGPGGGNEGGIAAPGGGGAPSPGGGVGGSAPGGEAVAGAALDQVQDNVGEDLIPTDYEANQIIKQYANDVLGISVTVIGSGASEGTVNIPISTDSGIEAAADVAAVTYAAVIQGGAASVSLGDGEVSGDVNGDIQDASLGSYSLIQPGTAATDENSALSVIQSTYPGIANLPYTAIETSGTGGEGNAQTYLFMAQSQQQEVDVQTGQAVIIAQAVLVGVTISQRQSVVYAIVGRGSFATSIMESMSLR